VSPVATNDTVRAESALTVSGISKIFGATKALDDVTIEFPRGRVTALLGPNGCGKSTLIKILAGYHEPDAGSIELGGRPMPTPIRPRAAYSAGMRFVHQDLGLVEEMSIADNFALAQGYRRWPLFGRIQGRRLRSDAAEALARLDLTVDPATMVKNLSRTEEIMVGIARALQVERDAAPDRELVIVLDEPTASLPEGSVERVLDAVTRIRDAGGTVIYVTHRIDEVLRVADDVVILRDGIASTERPLAGLDAKALASLVAGVADPTVLEGRSTAQSEVLISVRNLSGPRLRDISFDVHRGEIFGVAGLAGCGRSELARMLSGVQQPDQGEILLEGKEVDLGSPRAAISNGIAMVPAERTKYGCIPALSVRHNVALSDLKSFTSHGHLDQGRERAEVAELLERFDVRPKDTERRLEFLSGGNQQKTVIAKFARLDPKVLVVDEPTQGVDIAGKAEIALVLRRLAENGCGVVVASSDLDEIGALCDRVAVLDRGSLVGIFERGTVNEQRVAILSSRDRGGEE
jgi:ribose transport system ATP-binding protein